MISTTVRIDAHHKVCERRRKTGAERRAEFVDRERDAKQPGAEAQQQNQMGEVTKSRGSKVEKM